MPSVRPARTIKHGTALYRPRFQPFAGPKFLPPFRGPTHKKKKFVKLFALFFRFFCPVAQTTKKKTRVFTLFFFFVRVGRERRGPEPGTRSIGADGAARTPPLEVKFLDRRKTT